MVGTFSLAQKVKPVDVANAVCSRHSMQWMQYVVDAVRSGCSGIVVYGGGDIAFGAKRSNQRMQ